MNTELQQELSKLRAEFESRLSDVQMGMPFFPNDMMEGRSGADVLPSNFTNNRVISFGCTNSGLVVTVTPGKLYFKGVSKTITNLPATVTLTATRFGYISINLSAATAEWLEATADPGDGDDDTEIWRIFKATVTGTTITELIECQHGDIHSMGNA
jgi:hypothetical protein